MPVGIPFNATSRCSRWAECFMHNTAILIACGSSHRTVLIDIPRECAYRATTERAPTMYILLLNLFWMVGLCVILWKLFKQVLLNAELVRTCSYHLVPLRHRVNRALSVKDARGDLDSILSLPKRCVHFLDRAKLALDDYRPDLAYANLDLVSSVMAWVEFALENPNADIPHRNYFQGDSSSDRLASGLWWLERRDHSAAECAFAEEYYDENSHDSARRAAVTGYMYINVLLGRFKEVKKAEKMLIKLPTL